MATMRCRCSGKKSLPVFSRRSANARSATVASSSSRQCGRRRRRPAASGTVSRSKQRIGVIRRFYRRSAATPTQRSTRRQIFQRIDWLPAAANLKVQSWRFGIALAEFSDALAALDTLALLDQQSAIVGIRRNEVITVLDDQQVAKAAQAVAGIDDGAVTGRKHRITVGAIEVDALV